LKSEGIHMLPVFRYGYCWKCFFVYSNDFDEDDPGNCQVCEEKRVNSYRLTLNSIEEHVKMVTT